MIPLNMGKTNMQVMNITALMSRTGKNLTTWGVSTEK